MLVAKFFSEAKKLTFEDRVELAHRLWDEFMDGFQGWKAPPMPEGFFAWKTLKAQIDAGLSRDERIELAQRMWGNIQDDGYDPAPTPEQIVQKVLPEVKRTYFPLWTAQVAQRLGIVVKIHEDNIPLLEDVE